MTLLYAPALRLPAGKGIVIVLEPGAQMPRVETVDDTGKSVNTADFLGSTLVLWFYPKDDTPG